MKFISLLILLFSFSHLQAQIDDLIKNDSITWLAEWDADYLVDDFEEADILSRNLVGVLKYLDKSDFFNQSTPKNFLASRVWAAIKADKINVFSDRDFKKKFAENRIFYGELARKELDGDFEIDSTVYETRTCRGMWGGHTTDDVKFYRMHQIVYYNAPKAQFQMRVLAVSPVINSYTMQGNYELEPLFWFKPDMNKPNLSSDDIVWAQKIVSKNNSLDFTKAKVLKNTMADTLRQHFFQSLENQMDIPFYGTTEYGYSLEKLDNRQRENFLHPID